MATADEADRSELLTVAEAAERLRVGTWVIRDMLENGELQGVRVRARWRVVASSLPQPRFHKPDEDGGR